MRRIALLFTALVMSIGALAITAPAAQARRQGLRRLRHPGPGPDLLQRPRPQGDPHGLDADGDGIACESNPCPCSTGGGGGGNNGGDAARRRRNQTLRQRARVIRVIDGDTVKVRIASGPKHDVRLIGIDTPEVYGGVECWGRKASRATKKLLPRGTRVVLTSDPTQDLKDRYGRLLRYVTKGKTDINRKMVRSGHARVYVYNHHPFKRTASYKLRPAPGQEPRPRPLGRLLTPTGTTKAPDLHAAGQGPLLCWWAILGSRVVRGQRGHQGRFEDALRESRSGRLISYRSRKEAKAALDELGPLHHAYQLPPARQGRAVRLALAWKGTYDEFVETLPGLLE